MDSDKRPTSTPHDDITALLRRLDRVAAARDTLRSMAGDHHGELSPSVPPLLESLARDLRFASRDIATLQQSLSG